MTQLEFETHQRQEMLEITARVQDTLKSLKANHGLCFVHSPHTTGGLTINEKRRSRRQAGYSSRAGPPRSTP